jgi:hypothetical protein
MHKTPDVNMVDHIFQFIHLHKQRMGLKEQLRQVEDNLSLFE